MNPQVVRGAGGVRLAITTYGPRDAPVIVIAHGVGSSARFVRDTFGEPAAAAGWRLVTYDLRGHGDGIAHDPAVHDPAVQDPAVAHTLTDPAAHRLEHHVSDLLAVVEATGATAIGGVSLGAHAAIGCVVAGAPVRGAIACLPAWTGRAVPGEGMHAAVAAEAERDGVPAMLARLQDDTTMAPWLREVLVRDWTRHDPGHLAAALRALDGGVAPTEADLRGLPVPLGVVGWPGDPGHPLAVAEDWSQWAPRASMRAIMLTDPDTDRTAMGRAAFAALADAMITPDPT